MRSKYFILLGILGGVFLYYSIFSYRGLVLNSPVLNVRCKGFFAHSSLNIEIQNPSLFPKIAFLELRSPGVLDYQLQDWEVQTVGLPSLVKTLQWIGFPLKPTETRLLVPLYVGPRSETSLQIAVSQIIRNRIDLPLIQLAGTDMSAACTYSIEFDPSYEEVHSSTEPVRKPSNHSLQFHLDAGTRTIPRFEWEYEQIIPIQASMG